MKINMRIALIVSGLLASVPAAAQSIGSVENYWLGWSLIIVLAATFVVALLWKRKQPSRPDH